MRAGVLFSVFLAIAGCTNTPQQIAENACPFIAITRDDQKAKRLSLLTDQGMNATKAADLLDTYEMVLSDKYLNYDKRELCVASVSENKEVKDRIVADIAHQAVEKANERRALP